MEIRKLKESEILPIIANEYKKDFPRNQRKSKKDIIRVLTLNIYSAWGIFENGQRVGYFFGYAEKNAKTLVFDYFAIDCDKRGNKLGSKAIAMLDNCDAFKNFDAFVGELDNPNYIKFNKEHKALAMRKLEFFRRMGFVETGLQTKAFGVNLIVVRKVKPGKTVASGEEFKTQMDNIYKKVYGKSFKHIKTKLVK